MMRIHRTWILALCASGAMTAAPKRECSVTILQLGGYNDVMFHGGALGSGVARVVFPESLTDGAQVQARLSVNQVEIQKGGDLIVTVGQDEGKLAAISLKAATASAPLRNGETIELVVRRSDATTRRLLITSPAGETLCQVLVPVRFQRYENSRGQDEIPVLVDTTEYLRIARPFASDLSQIKATIGDNKATVLAKWPAGIVVEVPEKTVGLLPVRITDGREETEEMVRFVSLDIEKKSGTARVKASGLNGLMEPVDVVLQNSWLGVPFAETFKGRVNLNPFSKDRKLQFLPQRIYPKDVKEDGTASLTFRPKHGGVEYATVSVLPSFGPLRIRTVVQAVMSEWSTQNGIDISPEAQNLIVKQFEDGSDFLQDAVTKPRPHPWFPDELLTAVTESYLYALRDVAREDDKRRRGFVTAFRFQAEPDRAAATTINASDVTQHPLKEFLRRIWARIKDDAVRMEIKSDPPGLRVFVDDEFKGLTVTATLLSPGPHSVTVKTDRGRNACPPDKVVITPDHWQVWQRECSKGQWKPVSE
jgi:hypothetical protein